MPFPPPPLMSKFTDPKLGNWFPLASLVPAAKMAPSNSPLPPPFPRNVVVPSPSTRMIPFQPEFPWYWKFPVTTSSPYPVLGTKSKLPSTKTTLGLEADMSDGQVYPGPDWPKLSVVPLLLYVGPTGGLGPMTTSAFAFSCWTS